MKNFSKSSEAQPTKFESTRDYYDRFKNANLMISNNANPFLISPYSPNQISQTTGNNILAADIIKSYTSGNVIQVKSPMNIDVPSANNSSGLFVNDLAVVPFLIHAGAYPGDLSSTPGLPFATWGVAVNGSDSTIYGTFGTNGSTENTVVEIRPTVAKFANDGGGTFTVQVGNTSTPPNCQGVIDVQNTGVLGPAALTTLAGYMPFKVNGTTYYVPYYSSP